MKLPALQKDILYSDIEERIKSFKSKKSRYLFFYRLTRLAVFLGGGLITVITGWQLAKDNASATCFLDNLAKDENSKNIILLISASISLLTAVEGLFNFREKGKGNDVLLFNLRRLRDQICFAQSQNQYDKRKAEFFLEYQKIIEAQRILIENSDDDK